MNERKPNVVLVYADDLGRGMLSCYGQKHFKTPNIDRLSSEGVRFTNAYGCAFCAPARASLLTGYHDCHAGRWSFTDAGIYFDLSSGRRNYAEIREVLNSTSFTERDDEQYLAEILLNAGYATGQIGKLEWGFATTPERLDRHGWQYHYGFYDHLRCHGFYPPFLFENGQVVGVEGNEDPACGVGYDVETPESRAERTRNPAGRVYSQDLFDEKIVRFIKENAHQPFFLFHPSQLPHGPIAIPEIHESVASCVDLTTFEKEYASMVIRLDTTVGLILDQLEEERILDDTAVIFCSDNGHEVYACEPGRCSGTRSDIDGRKYDPSHYKYYSERSNDVFDGNDGMAGAKLSSLEGGTRIPYIVRWPGKCPEGAVCDALIANYDMLPTVGDMAMAESPGWKDGQSLVPAYRGLELVRRKPYVVFAGVEGPALVHADGWKVRYILVDRRFELYQLNVDYREERDLASSRPDKVRELGMLLLQECDGNYLHGTAENHKAGHIDDYMKGAGPEDAFPHHPHVQSRVGP